MEQNHPCEERKFTALLERGASPQQALCTFGGSSNEKRTRNLKKENLKHDLKPWLEN